MASLTRSIGVMVAVVGRAVYVGCHYALELLAGYWVASTTAIQRRVLATAAY
jgi:hypothetical protein